MGKKKEVPQFDLSFIEPDFSDAMLEWLTYKCESKDYYKTQRGVEICYKNLKKLSGNNPNIAIEIVEQSIGNNWKGLFPIKNNGNRFNNNRQEREAPSIFDVAEQILQGCQR